MTQHRDATAAAVTVADAGGGLLRELLGRNAGCFPRRETRQSATEMVGGLLMELEDYNCWPVAEAVGHAGPHRLQHLLSRAAWDDGQVLERAGAWAAERLDNGEAVLIVDETADAKSSTDAAGAARQYSGTLGGIALCQAAVTLTFASSRGHALIDRALYLPEARAADEEHRELAGIPDGVAFATKPHLAGQLLERARQRGIRAAFVAGAAVYGGRKLCQAIRSRGMGYVLAIRPNTTVTPGSGLTVTPGWCGVCGLAVPAGERFCCWPSWVRAGEGLHEDEVVPWASHSLQFMTELAELQHSLPVVRGLPAGHPARHLDRSHHAPGVRRAAPTLESSAPARRCNSAKGRKITAGALELAAAHGVTISMNIAHYHAEVRRLAAIYAVRATNRLGGQARDRALAALRHRRHGTTMVTLELTPARMVMMLTG